MSNAVDDDLMKIPSFMKAAVAIGFGDVDKTIEIRTDWPTPTFPKSTDTTAGRCAHSKRRRQRDPLIIIRVLTCALAPGDVRLLSGKTDYIQLPEGGHPYVIGSDVCGIVVSMDDDAVEEGRFSIGDYVVARFDEPKPNGGVAEYRLVKSSLTAKCPRPIDPVHACGLPASAMAAKRIVRDYMRHGDNVLVIGGSGAVGSSVIQYAKLYGAKTVVAVSTQIDLCKRLGADHVIDYTDMNWWEVRDFAAPKEQFNIVYDLVNGGSNWEKGGHAGTAVRRDGTYVALMSGVQTDIEVHGIVDMIRLSFLFVGRLLWSRINPRIPKWVAPDGLKLEPGDLEELFNDVANGKVVPLVDPTSPFQFNTAGVQEAMGLQKSRHAHGKVVIEISKL